MKTERVSRPRLRRRDAVAFSVWIAAFAIAWFSFQAMRGAPREDGIAWPFRRALQFNGAIGEALVSPERVDHVFQAPPRGKRARVNGDLGLELRQPVDLTTYRLVVETPALGGGAPITMSLSMDELRALPRVELASQFKCIEGWSEVMSFAGVRFRDFLKAHRLGTHSGQEPDWRNRAGDLYRYVGLATPDGKYYVSIDLKSLLGPNTLLAYEQNGEPLTAEHGAPLRLFAPNKYGVKNLKKVGRIVFSDTPLPDYWGEQGYDWFIGL